MPRLQRDTLLRARATGAGRASTSRSPGSGRCGTSPTARSPAASRRRTCVSDALGWDVVPPTVLRDGPSGPAWCSSGWSPSEDDEAVTLVDVMRPRRCRAGFLHVLDALGPTASRSCSCTRTTRELRRMAVFDVVVNNADRKGGHVLADARRPPLRRRPRGLFHVEHKLRTVLWGWAGEPLA